MAQARSRARTLGAITILAGLLPLTAGGAAATDASSPSEAPTLRGRAGKVIATYDAAAIKAEPQPAPEPDSSKGAVREQTAPSDTALSDAAGPTTTDGECQTGNLWVDSLTDRTIVNASWAGAESLTLMRLRELGAWATVGTFSGATMTYIDHGLNPRTGASYRMVARHATGAVLMDCSTYFSSVGTSDGWGEIDAVVGHDTALVIQPRGSWSPTPAVTGGGAWLTPAFSADGRLVAATRVDPETGVGVLEVRRSRNAALVFTVDLGPEVSVADPAFSVDGQTLAYSRYVTETGEPLGLGFVDVHGSHVKRALTANVAVAEPAWRPNGTLVVSTFGASEGLANLCATCTTVSPIPGTTGGYTAEVGADNTVYFTTADDASSAVKRISPAGSVSTLRSSATDFFISPRLSPSGRLFVERDAPNPYSSEPTVRIVELSPMGEAGDEVTGIGEYNWSPPLGYDIRQPQSKGTSHFAGDANEDLVVRDGYGKLWAYRGTALGLGSRTQIGSGWSTYTAVVPIGDLNSDDRPDLLGRDAYGKLWLYPGIGNGKFGARVQMGSGWNPYTLVAPGDWDGDDKADLIARDSSGYLWLYPGKGTGRVGARKLIGSGWGSFNTILGAGDANFDNKADLIARDSYGRLWLYPGNGRGGFLAKRQIGSGWGGFTALTVTEFGTGTVRVWARTSAGQLVRYHILGDGSFMHGQFPLGYGWNGLLITS